LKIFKTSESNYQVVKILTNKLRPNYVDVQKNSDIIIIGLDDNHGYYGSYIKENKEIKSYFQPENLKYLKPCNNEKIYAILNTGTLVLIYGKSKSIQIGFIINQCDAKKDSSNICSVDLFNGKTVHIERGYLIDINHIVPEQWVMFHLKDEKNIPLSHTVLRNPYASSIPYVFSKHPDFEYYMKTKTFGKNVFYYINPDNKKLTSTIKGNYEKEFLGKFLNKFKSQEKHYERQLESELKRKIEIATPKSEDLSQKYTKQKDKINEITKLLNNNNISLKETEKEKEILSDEIEEVKSKINDYLKEG
jgi:hypothetical protein